MNLPAGGKNPVFMSATPQFMKKAKGNTARDSWHYCNDLGLDIIQVGHPSFYPVKVLQLDEGDKYIDDFGRTHVITRYYDEYCAPFPLQTTRHVHGNLDEIRKKWEKITFPDPEKPEYLSAIEEIHELNEQIDDPLSIWGVINGPLEPTWQLLSDGWPEFFILARLDVDLALDIIERVTDYSIEAGKALINRGADAIRIGDDYALNNGLMVSKETWKTMIYPFHKKLVAGLKKEGGANFPVILHSDGNIMDIIDLLGRGGIDALNPIQPDALKLEDVLDIAGDTLAITGAFDLRYFLDPPTPRNRRKIRNEVHRLMDIVDRYNESNGKNIGFCIGPTHQVQPASHVDTFEYWVKIVHEINEKRAGL
jgi:uroporphyrinogen-III decarboxylase